MRTWPRSADASPANGEYVLPGADDEHPERRRARRQQRGLSGVHGDAGWRPDLCRGTPRRHRDLSRAPRHSEEGRPFDRRGRRRRLRAEPEIQSRGTRRRARSDWQGRAPRRHATCIIALDVASSELWDNGKYVFKKSGEATRTSDQMVELYVDWVRQYPIISIEDGVAEGDWDGWKLLTRTLGDRVQLVGDDVFVTNPEILRRGISDGVGNALLVKLNQIGTVSETLDAIDMAREARLRHRHLASIGRNRRQHDRRFGGRHVGRPDQDRLRQPQRSRREIQPAAADRRRARRRGPLRWAVRDPAAGNRLKTANRGQFDATAGTASSRREHVEQGEPLHGLDRRRSQRQGPGRGTRGRPSDERREVRVRRRLHVGAEARHSDVVDCARRARHDVDSGLSVVAA